MDRRLIILVALALAVVGSGVRLAPAQSPAAPPPPPASPTELRAAPAELPAVPVEAVPPAPAAPAPDGSTAPAPAPLLAPPPPPPATQGAPRDLQLERSDLPPLEARPAASDPSAKKAGAAHEVDPFVLPPERLPLGRQSVALTVDVVGPQVLNINQVTTLRIIVRNTGTSDAMGVVVRDELPESLSFLSSQPEAEHNDSLLFWRLTTVPAGAEKVILVRVKPIKVGPFDHAATVTLMAGGKSRTIVREPKLKVELTATSGKVLKGQQVQFKIAISNPGDGPARNVVVQAKLSPGLKHESGEPNDQNLFEQTLDQIEPGQRVVLDALVADTLLDGEQTCTVAAVSTDVTTGSDDARTLATVTVIEPKLKIAIVGDEKRFTDTIATYNITVENPGTATAHGVRVLATLPVTGRLVGPPPTRARWDPSSGKLLWTIPQVEPGEKEKVTLTFQVRMGGVGFYKVSVDSRADGGLSDRASCSTDVAGLADFEFEVIEQRRVVDVGDTTSFKIRIKNVGTKEATNLLVRARFSPNIEVKATNGNDGVPAMLSKTEPLVVFPPIERLAYGKEIVLGLQVIAKEKGLGTCRVYLMHDDLTENEQLDDMAAFKITAPR